MKPVWRQEITTKYPGSDIEREGEVSKSIREFVIFPTGSDTPISWMKANVFYWNRGMCRSIQLWTLPSRDSLPWVRKRMPVYQFIFIKGQGPREAQSKRKKLLLRKSGFTYLYWLKLPEKSNLKELSFDQTWLCESSSPDSALTSQPHSLAKTRTRLL